MNDVERANAERLVEVRSAMLRLVPSHTMIDDRGLRASRKVLAVRHLGQWHYPGFQFDANAEPYPEIAKVIETLGAKARGFDILHWFLLENEFLAGRTPLQTWAEDRAAVVAAAAREHWFEPD